MRKFLCILLIALTMFSVACQAKDDGSDNSTPLSKEEFVSQDSSAPVETAKVPDVSGMTPDQAQQALKDAGFDVFVSYKSNDTVPKGEVAGTDYAPGTEVEKGETVCLYVSDGKSLLASSLDYKQSALVEARTELPQGANNDYMPVNYEFVKGIWLSQYDMEALYKTGGQRDEADFRKLADQYFSGLADIGFNTVYVQLRPNGDSFYPSAYYCPSNYVTGGYAIDFTYDPLAILVEAAHKYNLSFHGWINPLRCMTPSDLKIINVSYGLRKFEQDGHYGDYIFEFGGRLYANPGRAEVRELIINGAAEIVRYYDVDGVHIDDYFYPGSSRDHYDEAAFKAQSEFTTYLPFRMDSLNKLVSGIYSAVKAENPNVQFGISPAGNLSNVRGAAADIDKWLSTDGYMDYVIPQIYWGFDNGRYSFDKIYYQWSALKRSDNVKFIVGMDLSHAAASTDPEWANNKDVLKRCLEYAEDMGNCAGFSLFSAGSVLDCTTPTRTPSTEKELANLFAKVDLITDKAINYKD